MARACLIFEPDLPMVEAESIPIGGDVSLAEPTPGAAEAALTEEFGAAIADARERISALLEPACPTTAFLAALREEVNRAAESPDSVPYPELADPDAYWEATVRPQAKSLRDSVEAIVAWLEQRIVATMEVAEDDLKATVDAAAADPGPDPATVRQQLTSAIDARCLALHHQMAQVIGILPAQDGLVQARQSAAEALRAQATADVESLKTAYLRDAGGDEEHQRFAEQEWSETFADRVAHRHAMLAALAPWRHVEFALVGYERVVAETERIVEAAAVRLQAPLRGLQPLFLERFDDSLQTAG